MTHSQVLWKNSLVKRLVALALEEDMPAGDITTELCLQGSDAEGVGQVVARQSCIISGLGCINAVFEELGVDVEVLLQASDGEAVGKGDQIASIRGRAADILSAERTVLNFLQRLSGIATFTAKVVECTKKLTVLDTRKTTPGWRLLEKAAVRDGGGQNHRMNLSEMAMVKDNHIDLSGESLPDLLARILKEKAEDLPVEVEVRSQEELTSIAGIPVDAILLDNMNNAEIQTALSYIETAWNNPPLIEISGNITAERFSSLEEIGVQRVSMGALTYNAPAVDLALDLKKS